VPDLPGFILVAGIGFEPMTFQVMSLTRGQGTTCFPNKLCVVKWCHLVTVSGGAAPVRARLHWDAADIPGRTGEVDFSHRTDPRWRAGPRAANAKLEPRASIARRRRPRPWVTFSPVNSSSSIGVS
jgi:hypothetical protein